MRIIYSKVRIIFAPHFNPNFSKGDKFEEQTLNTISTR